MRGHLHAIPVTVLACYIDLFMELIFCFVFSIKKMALGRGQNFTDSLRSGTLAGYIVVTGLDQSDQRHDRRYDDAVVRIGSRVTVK